MLQGFSPPWKRGGGTTGGGGWKDFELRNFNPVCRGEGVKESQRGGNV